MLISNIKKKLLKLKVGEKKLLILNVLLEGTVDVQG